MKAVDGTFVEPTGGGPDPPGETARRLGGLEEPGTVVNGFQRAMLGIRERAHERCVVCGSRACQGLHVRFSARSDGSVQGVLERRPELEGYANTLHGGVVSMLLDAAMTNCLFAHGCIAVTAELTVRFLHPVAADRPATVRAWVRKSGHRLHLMCSELRQGGRLMASAEAKFVVRPPGDGAAISG